MLIHIEGELHDIGMLAIDEANGVSFLDVAHLLNRCKSC